MRELLSVTVYGADGEASVVDPAGIETDLSSRPARLLISARVAPARRLNGIEVDFTAGFGETGVDVPDPLKRAVMTLAAHWYEFRTAYGAADQPVSLPRGFDRLIAPLRAGRL